MSRFSSIVIVAAAAVATATVLISGCSGAQSSKSSSSSSAGSAVFGAADAGNAPAAPVPAASAAAGSKETPATSTDGTGVVLKSSALIETADLTVQTPQVTQMAARASTIATAAGGSVTAEVVTDASGSSTNRIPASADVTLAVPPESLQPVLTQLDRLGTEQSRHTSTQDVTGQVADVTSRVASAQASIARLQVLFEQAQKVSDIVDIENELSQREADLESLQAQQRALSAQTSNAVITLHLVSNPVTTVVHHSSARGFGAGLSHGWHAFAASVAWTLTAVGAGLPFLAVLAIVLAAFLIIRRRHGSGAQPVIPAASGPGVGE
jgi:hypothetical protein